MEEQIDILFSNQQLVKKNTYLQNTVEWNVQNSYFLTSHQEKIVCIVQIEHRSFEVDDIRMLAGDIARELGAHGIKIANISLHDFLQAFDSFAAEELVIAFVEGWELGSYSFSKYKTKAENIKTELRFRETTGIEVYSETGKIRANAVAFTRDLVNEIPSALNPSTFPKYLEKAFKNTKVTMKLLDEAEMNEMHGVRAVNKGSSHPAQFIELAYCSDSSKPLVALVGKGVTFDTGGVSLKVRKNISSMKMDMGGAGAVVGAVKLLADMNAQVNIVGLIPVVENILSEHSVLPGDIIRYKNNLTVEIGNTDAEGRLILADGILRANELGAEYVVDIATLTGSVKQALGNEMAGIFGGRELTKRLEEIGNKNGDFVWGLPLVNKYERNLTSNYADINNIASGDAPGSIIAALFLRYFVEDTSKWLHIDMAAVARASDKAGYYPNAASGYGTRLLADYVTYISNQNH